MSSRESTGARPSPIAVVGMSTLMPGSQSPAGFWRDILEGADRMTEVPRSHWLAADYFDPKPGTPDKLYVTRGGFLGGTPFSPMEFALLPSALPSTDPEQLLGLVVARRALDEATRGRLGAMDRSRISVVLGVGSATELATHMAGRLQIPVVEHAMRDAGLGEDEVGRVKRTLEGCYVPWQESTFPGLLSNVVAGRIANRLDLGGTNAVVDAACASSLAALHLACNELALHQADLVLSGGVDTLNGTLMFMCFAQTGALSLTGDCRPFSSEADGTMLGEGVGMVALKRLEDAERDGDAIYGVIRSIGSSSDGRAKSIYAPAAAGQAIALRRAYERAGYGAGTVELIEAHGTATRAGDAAEVEALRAVFDEAGAPRDRCALGSVKSQIGHTKSAAGVAGLVKSLLALHHKVLPRTIKVKAPNPALGLDGSPFYLSTETRPWVRAADHPRRASVSALGFGGTNFHVTLEEYTGPAPRPPRLRTLPSELVLLAAPDAASLAAACEKLAAQPIAPGGLAAVARRTQLSFDAGAPRRLAVVAESEADLAVKLREAVATINAPRAAAPAAPEGGRPAPGARPGNRGALLGEGEAAGPVALLFPGQGSQYVNMGRDLAVHFDCARAEWDRAANLATGSDERLHHRVFPPPVFDEAAEADRERRLMATEWAQPALVAASLAMRSLLEKLGVRPLCVGGHSLGEVSALCAAGAFDADEALRIARRRGELAAAAGGDAPGAMLAVSAERARVDGWIDAWGVAVVVANHNAPDQVVVSGDAAAIDRVEVLLRDAGVNATRVPVSSAFHSPVVAPSVAPFRQFLDGAKVEPPRLPVFANATALPYPEDATRVKDDLAAAIAQPVRFVEQVEAMWAAGARTFIEVGPRGVLSRLVDRCLGERPHLAVPLDASGKHGVTALWEALGRLAVAGVPLEFSALWEGQTFPEAEVAAATGAAKMSVEVTGAIVNKPYPSPSGELPAMKPAPAPARAAAPAPPRPPSPLAPPPAAPHAAAPPPQAAPPMAFAPPPPARSAAVAAPPPAPAHVAPAAMAPVAPHAAGPGLDVASLVHLQAPAIAAQLEFQRVMAESHAAFLRAIETSYAALGLAGGVVAGPSLPAPAFAPAPLPLAAPPAWAPAPNAPPPVAAPVHAAPPLAPTPPASPVASAVAPTAPAAPSVDLVALMLSIVADKTGYPAELIELTQDLESDLGIDSIKRVEILSAVRERAPSLPAVDPGRMARMRTLGEIVEYFRASMPEPPASAVAVSAPASSAPSPSVDLVALMLSIVADKTGYPAELIELTQDLESDLGIDSIKRVEILSAVRERAPSLPAVDPGRMARMRTLGEIVEYFRSSLPEQPVAAAAVASPPAPAAIDLVPLMLSIVADKTGYPAELIELTQDLESDLGIDSIKRVEILSAVRERAPSLPAVDPGRMARMRTLGEIVEYFRASVPEAAGHAGATGDKNGAKNGASHHGASNGASQNGAAHAAPANGHAPPKSEVPAPVGRFAVRAVPAAAAGFALPGLLGAGSVCVTPDGGGVAAALVERLVARGVAARAVSGPGELGEADAVIFLGGLRPILGIDQAIAVDHEAFAVARAVADRLGARGGAFVTVQDTGGDFGLGGGAGERAWLGGLAALAKTAAAEWPEAQVLALDVERGGRGDDALAEAIAGELLAGGTEEEVGLGADGARRTVVSVPEPAPAPARAVEEGAVFVVSGGARGVTATALLALARASRPRFLLLGRSPLAAEPADFHGVVGEAALKRAALEAARREGAAATPREISRRVDAVLAGRAIRDTLAQLAAAGSEARYEAVDVRDPARLTPLLDDVRRAWGPIRGLVHGAGVLADALLPQKTDEQFARVFDTKVGGLRGLLEATAADPLGWICLFSSIAARTGNAGQADYAMANAVLDQVAAVEARRRGAACRVVSIGWGPWEGGMVTPVLAQHFASLGVALLPLAAGAAAFVHELEGDGDVQVVVGGDVSARAAAGRGHRMAADVVVDARSWPQLDGHRVQGQVVLPVVLVHEWFARIAAGLHGSDERIQLRDLRVLRGVRLGAFDGGGTERFRVRALPGEGGALHLELRDERGALRYSATADAELASAVPRDPIAPDGVGLQPSPWGDGAMYGPSALFHGPGFQVLRQVDGVSGQAARATMMGTRAAGWPAQPWLGDPAALDGALQLALLFAQHAGTGPTLPLRVARIDVYPRTSSDAPQAPLRCQVTVRERSAERLVCDLAVDGEGGARLADLVGVELFAVPSGTAAR